MDIIKPEPLRLGDRYYYTLTSYEPVNIEVLVPRVTNTDVDMALGQVVAEHEAARSGGETPARPPAITDEWVAREFPDIKTVEALRRVLARQLEQINAQAAEESKAGLCAEQLAKRLVQSVPEIEVDRIRTEIQQSMAADLAREGMTVSDLIARTGFEQMSINALLNERAKDIAEQDAAIDAFSQERKLKIEDGELPQYLGVPFDQASKIISDARAAGQIEMMRAQALRLKALRIVEAECSCTYVQESPEEAAKRSEQYRRIMENAVEKLGKGEVADNRTEGEKRGFKLVE